MTLDTASFLRPRNKAHFIAWRFNLLLGFIFCLALGLALRIFDLSILNQSFLQHQGDQRVLRIINTPALRGMIFDRNGAPLAVSTKVYSIWVDPLTFEVDAARLAQLSHLMHQDSKTLTSVVKLAALNNRQFVYLQRSISPELAQQILMLRIPGVYAQENYRRFYPEGEATAQIVGITNVDDQGQEGLELGYNDWLQGVRGQQKVIKDRLGRVIADVGQSEMQKPGHDLTLSIDKQMQYVAYRELVTGVKQTQADSGSVVVLDVKTGEVLAMVNHPSFNPNQRPLKIQALRNRAVTDTFEPASTIKAFTVVAALESGLYRPDSIIDTSPGWMRLDHHLVKDAKNNGPLTLTQILKRSSNMGAAKIVLTLPPDQLWSVLHRVGFGEITAAGFPGEQSGYLLKHDPWGAFTLATLSFGYGLSVTALQLARAYAVIANDGVKLPLSFLKVSELPKGERVLSEKVAQNMRMLLESVLDEGGTGISSRVPGFKVAGKTGTARMVGKEGYEKHRYTASFVGMAPLAQPRVVVLVVLHGLEGKNYTGGKAAGPIFSKVMTHALRILAVPPDNL